MTFESFGSVSTLVNLIFEIFDLDGNLVYFREDSIIVMVEEVHRYGFEDLNLSDGEYEFVLGALYNVDVEDEFRIGFVVRDFRGCGLFGFDLGRFIFCWYWLILILDLLELILLKRMLRLVVGSWCSG